MEEFQKDLKSLVEHAECFNEKHGGCILLSTALGVDEERAACQVLLKGGEPADLHMLCRGLLHSPRFADEMMDAIKCVLKHNNPRKDDLSSILMEHSMDALKKLLVTIAIKEEKERAAEKSADQVVNDFLDAFYHGEGN